MQRREFISIGAALAASVGLTLAGCGGDANNNAVGITPVLQPSLGPLLQQPAVRSSANGVLDTVLTAQLATNTIGTNTFESRTYEGTIPAPTLRIQQGDRLRIRVDNQLPPNPDQDLEETNGAHHLNSTNLHTHGLHVSPNAPSDDVLLEIDPGASFQYEYQIGADHPDGTYWYHPHKHGSVAIQEMNGMAGALIIEGPLDRVPEVAAARDVVMLFQQITLNDQDESPQNFDEIDVGPQLYTVNGQLVPVHIIASGEVQRWRFLNATWETFMPLQLEGHNFHQLAVDGNTFPQVVEKDHVFLAPANRSDVLVRGGVPGRYMLRKLSYFQELEEPRPAVDLLIVQVTPRVGAPMALPTTLPAPATLDFDFPQIDNTRTLEFQEQEDEEGNETFPIVPFPGGPSLLFDPDRVDQTMQLGSAEEWTLLNSSPDDHPFHIHINPFLVIELNGVPLAQPIWQDTVIIPKQVNGVKGSVKFRTRFRDFTGTFVLHCHILDHEDSGMMEVIEVV